MSFSEKELIYHCRAILQNRRILSKAVILCEGKIDKPGGRLSPQSYKKMEDLPDANFYKACLPIEWRYDIPVFFNCGSRNSVLDSYFKLLTLHEQDPENSYLTPEKLFAFVDLDLPNKSLDEDYLFCDIDAIFDDLYQRWQVNQDTASNHRIWVTGLIHKEAYFIFPHLQELFNEHTAFYQSSPAILKNIYLDIASEIPDDIDLKDNLARVKKRICHCQDLDTSTPALLQESWQKQYQNCDETAKFELILALLTLRKAKNYWLQIEPDPEWPHPVERYREQLLLQIGRFYGKHSDNPIYHISHLLKILYDSLKD